MKKILLALAIYICCTQMYHSQEEDGVVSLALPIRNSLTFNQYAINPTFSFVRQQNNYFSITNKREWVQFEDAPQTYLASYSGRFSENSGLGIGLFQQNYGVLTTFGGIANFAYNVRLARDSNLTFGLNVGAYKSGVNSKNVVTNFADPSLENIPSNFLLTINPGINYGTGFLDFGLSINNLALFNTSELIEDNPGQIIQGHIMYTGYLDMSGFFDESKFSGLVRSEFGNDKTVVSGLAMLTVPKGIWAQIGYNNLYGASGGLGMNITKQIAIEYNFEKALGDLTYFGPSHEITLAYRFKNKENYDYSREDEVSALFSGDRKKPVSNVNAEENRRLAAEAKAEAKLLAEAKLKADAEAKEAEEQARLIEEAKAKELAAEKVKLAAEEKAKADAQAKIDAEAARLEVEAQAKEVAEAKAKIAADNKAKADAQAKAEALRLAEAAKIKEAAEQAKLDAESKAKEQAEAETARLAELARVKAELETQAKLEAEAARIAEINKVKEEAEAKAQAAADEQAKLLAEEQTRIEEENKAKKEAEALAQQQIEVDNKAEADDAKTAGQLNVSATDDIAKSMNSIEKSTEESKKAQSELLTRFTEAIENKDKDLKDLKEENDLSEKGIFMEPKPFKSLTAENNALEELKVNIDNIIETRNNRIKELETLYEERIKIYPLVNDEVNLYYQNTIKKLKSEQASAIQTKTNLISTLDDINVATEFERKRRIKRAAYDNEQDRFLQDRATLNIIKQNTPISSVVFKTEDFDFGEEQSSNIQILKNVKNIENGFYMIVAVHNDLGKRDDFVTKVVASGRKDIDFFYDVNTSKYYIYYDRFESIEEANEALKAKGNRPYNGKMSIVKIEN